MSRSKIVCALFLALCFQVLCGIAAHAQNITLYDANWGVVGPGQPFPHDRFSRGELCNVYVTVPDAALYRYRVVSDRGVERGYIFNWWTIDSFNIFTSPAADNVYVEVLKNNIIVARKRIPIGTK